MTVTIWHNPRCTKSRQTLALLEERGFAPKIVLYLETPPSEAEIAAALDLLGLGARAFMRKGEEDYRDQGLDDPALDDAALIAAMARTPKLIERPVVFAHGKAVIGRPPEAVLAIL